MQRSKTPFLPSYIKRDLLLDLILIGMYDADVSDEVITYPPYSGQHYNCAEGLSNSMYSHTLFRKMLTITSSSTSQSDFQNCWSVERQVAANLIGPFYCNLLNRSVYPSNELPRIRHSQLQEFFQLYVPNGRNLWI